MAKNPIGKADLEWIFARNCEGTEQLNYFNSAPEITIL